MPPGAAVDDADSGADHRDADTKRLARNRRLEQLTKHKLGLHVGSRVTLGRIADALYANDEADLDDLQDKDSIKHALGDWIERLLGLEGAPDVPIGTGSRDEPLGS